MSRGRALVIGGSLSGLLAALNLRRRGFAAEIFERVETELAGRGAGIVAQPQLRAVLSRLGIDTTGLGVDVTHRRIFDADGHLVDSHYCPQTLTSWDRVYRLLRQAFTGRYHRGKALARVEQQASGVTAHFADGTKAAGDLLIGADGLRSTVREQFLPGLTPLYAGYVAWRALILEAAIARCDHADLFAYMSFCLPPGEQFLGYPVVGANDELWPGRRRYNFVWYRPADEASELKELLTDGNGTTHVVSIPPPLIRDEVIAAMRAAARQSLAPQLRNVVMLAPRPFLQPIYDLAAPRLAFGRVALIGDAAFVARPHVAAGVAKAAADAETLTAAVAAGGDVECGLAHFEQIRLPVGRRIIERARHLGAYMQACRSPAERAFAQSHGRPQAVMRETAVLDFLPGA